MNAVVVSAFGPASVLQYMAKYPVPEPQGNQVLVNVKAAGVNPVDTYIREGVFPALPPLPYTPGLDGAGIVKKIGPDVDKIKEGERVFFCSRNPAIKYGSYAEYATVNQEDVWPLEDKLSYSEGAALGIPYLTAYRSLVLKANVQKGEFVLVHGASGATGIATVQIAKALSAKVIGTAGTTQGLELLKNLGVDAAFCHKDSDYIQKIQKFTDSRGVNVIVEMKADANLNDDLHLLAHRGRITVIGSHGNVCVTPEVMMGNEANIMGIAIFSSTDDEWDKTSRGVLQAIQEDWIHPVVNKQYPLAKASEAHHDIIHCKGAQGRLVILTDSSS